MCLSRVGLFPPSEPGMRLFPQEDFSEVVIVEARPEGLAEEVE